MSESSTSGGLRARLANSDLSLILITMFAIYVLFIAIGVLLFPSNALVGSLASSLQGVTKWAALYAMLALALNLHWGYTGLFNIGVAGFMAVGVYTMAILYNAPSANPPGLGVPFYVSDFFGAAGLPGIGFLFGLLLCVALGMVAAALIGALAALPALRLRADYLAIVTVALSEIIRRVLLSTEFQTFRLFANLDIKLAGIEILPDLALGTGSGQGINLPDNPVRAMYFVDPTDPSAGTTFVGGPILDAASSLGIRESVMLNWTYTLVLVGFVAVFYWLLVRTGNSPFGRVLKAIREDEGVAQALGKDTRRFKIKVFMLGCALMGLGGILWEGSKGFTDPTSTTFLPLTTFYVFIALIIGGAGSNTGSVLGGALFAGLLFEGPLAVMQVINKYAGLDGVRTPENVADALGAMAGLDFQPFLAFLFAQRSALRFVLVGVVLIVLIQNRPEGLLGHRKEEASAVDLMDRQPREDSGGGAVAADGGEIDE
jgi:ABC-type branched-subunit amino acid transport system permease subunit